MPTKYHTVTLPDGTTDTRESDTRAYTHAVVVVTTEAYKADRIAQAQRKLAELEAELVKVQAGVAAMTDADREQVAQLKAAYDHLEEEVVETRTRTDGSTYESKGPRWLSDAFRVTHPGGKARDAIDAASKAFRSTLPEREKSLTQNIEAAKQQVKSAEAIVVGKANVHRWSMSERGAQGGVADAQKWNGLKRIYVETNITVTESKPRAKKAEPVAQAKPAKAEKAPKTEAECPVCHTKVALSDAKAVADTFGFRTMGGKQYRQSNCRKCRGKSKPKAAAPEVKQEGAPEAQPSS